tara:strand:+ start:649 stop:1743 length:1095 start_codon:yes stop_codon:yes gene_type:complete
MKTIFSLMSAFLIGCVLATVSGVFGLVINPLIGGAASSLVLTFSGLHSFVAGISQVGNLCALQKEVWVADIMDNLFLGQEFIGRSIDDGGMINNSIVHIPQAGNAPSITKNRSSFPATIAERTDAELTYSVANFTTDPIRVRNFDEVQVSYAKRQSVLGEHSAALSERMGDEVAHIWSPTADAALVLRTTGAATADLAHATATGTRLRLTKSDVAKMAKKLDKDRMPKQGRTLLLSPEMYYELFEVDQLILADVMGRVTLPEGAINRLFGFDIMVRDTIVTYNNAAAGAKKAVGAAAAATDCLGAIAWSSFAVRHALGSIGVYLNEGQAEHYGDIMSAEVNLGASISRTDSKGIVSIAQGYVAP